MNNAQRRGLTKLNTLLSQRENGLITEYETVQRLSNIIVELTIGRFRPDGTVSVSAHS